MGQPTHAFDLDKIEGGIVVRRARKGEKLKTLDGVERTLDPEDLVVADHAKPLGLAGVMGGWDTMITPETKNVLVEAAWFDPMAVRRTARRHGLHTDASHRFERGADFNAGAGRVGTRQPHPARQRRHHRGRSRRCARPRMRRRAPRNRKPIALALSEVHRILGTTIDKEGITAPTVEDVLTALGCDTDRSELAEAQRSWHVTLPSWRLDLEREIDLIEEVARVYGYNRFANTLPAFGEGVRALPLGRSESAVRRTLLAAGFHEAIASTFCSAAEAALTAPQPGLVVPLGNPLSEEAGVLRPSLVPGMLAMIAGNLHRDVSDVRLFELGTVFSGTTEKVDERPALAFGATGNLPQSRPASAGASIDFHDLKGVVEQLLAASRPNPSTSTVSRPSPVSHRMAASLSRRARRCRRPHRRLVRPAASQAGGRAQAQRAGSAGRTLSRSPLQAAAAQACRARHLALPAGAPRFLSGRAGNVRWAEIDAALAARIPELVDWRAREVFRDQKSDGAREYSLLLGATFQAADRTLRDEELQAYSQHVVEAVSKVGARLRS